MTQKQRILILFFNDSFDVDLLSILHYNLPETPLTNPQANLKL